MSGPESKPGPLPPLKSDPAFYGLLSTQFLGAFNDNVFKQLVLFTCVMTLEAGGDDRSGFAQAVFAAPILFLSGFAGWLSDRLPKRGLIVASKVGELLVMLAGLATYLAFAGPSPSLVTTLLIVLAFMGVQTAFFGPPKYGVLPEMFRESDLPRVTGLVQMTTFVAIVLGMLVTGVATEFLAADGGLWKVSVIAVGISVAGIATAFRLRNPPTADPNLAFEWSSLGIHRDLWPLLRTDATVRNVLIVQSFFWLIAAWVQVLSTPLGMRQLGVGEALTGVLFSTVAIGIAVGSLLAGRLSGGRVRFGIVRAGTWLMVAALGTLAALGETGIGGSAGAVTCAGCLFFAGVGAGMFAIPLGVLLQARPPKSLKGRMIGAMNVGNWTGIILGGLLYQAVEPLVRDTATYSRLFAPLAIALIPIALFYRPSDVTLGRDENDEVADEPSPTREEPAAVTSPQAAGRP
ncbi:MAG: MFS transporter [Planctomycetota bacterium]